MKPRVYLGQWDPGTFDEVEPSDAEFVVGPHLAARYFVLEEELQRIRGFIYEYGQLGPKIEPKVPSPDYNPLAPPGWRVINGGYVENPEPPPPAPTGAFKVTDPKKPTVPRCPAGAPWVRVTSNFDQSTEQLVRTWFCGCGHSNETRSGCPHTHHKVNSAGRDCCAICGQVMVDFAMTDAMPGSGGRPRPISAPLKQFLVPPSDL